MPLTAIDTSVIVAAHLTQHDHHRVAFQAVEKTLEVEERIVLPLPSLVEAYSVLTKMPAPYRLSPSDAFRALKTSLQNVSEIAALSDQDAWPFFADLSRTIS